MLQKIRKHPGDASLCGITRTGSKGMSHFAFSIFAKTPSEGYKVLERRVERKLRGAGALHLKQRNLSQPGKSSRQKILFFLNTPGCPCRCKFIRMQAVIRANKFAPTSPPTIFSRLKLPAEGSNLRGAPHAAFRLFMAIAQSVLRLRAAHQPVDVGNRNRRNNKCYVYQGLPQQGFLFHVGRIDE